LSLRLRVNGDEVDVAARTDEMLLAVLRRAGFSSVRETCGIGVCGTCTVLVDGETVSACLLLAHAAAGRDVRTAEGLADDDPVARTFAARHAFQCGFCTPAMMLTAKRLLEESPSPSEEEIRVAMSGNLCRCGSYLKIIEAIKEAAT
jgi:aerobic-type carbon monoxide dehydrogenase small subunit (CoxS/CutS family)